MKNIKVVHTTAIVFAMIITAIGMQNCNKQVDFSQTEETLKPLGTPTPNPTPTPTPTLSDIQALVYGSDSGDRKALADKIAGYRAPSFTEVFSRWRRISGPSLYNKVDEIVVAQQTNSFCYTKILETGLWQNTTDPATGSVVSPSVSSICINQPWFAALSWRMTSTGRLAHATNSGNFNGFISGIKFDRYKSQAVVTSSYKDDDEIALIIAVVQDKDGKIHSLAAARSQGGYTAKMDTANPMNWRISYRINNVLTKTYGEQAVDVVNRISRTDPSGDGAGWNGKASLVRVVRDGNMIQAFTSNWGVNGDRPSALPIVSASKIELNLNEHSELAIFKGAQFTGYGMQSQPQTEFYDMSFSAQTDDQYVYDLTNDTVYEQQANGTYKLRNDLLASEVLQYPRKIGNEETQKEYLLRGAKDFVLSQ